MGEVVEGVAVGVVGELVAGCWQPLQALQRYVRKVSRKICVFRQYHRATCHEAVYEWLLPHIDNKLWFYGNTGRDRKRLYFKWTKISRSENVLFGFGGIVLLHTRSFWAERRRRKRKACVWFWHIYWTSMLPILLRKCRGLCWVIQTLKNWEGTRSRRMRVKPNHSRTVTISSWARMSYF